MDGLDADAGVIRALVELSLPWAEMVGRAGLAAVRIVAVAAALTTIVVITWRVFKPRPRTGRHWVDDGRRHDLAGRLADEQLAAGRSDAPTEFAREMAEEATTPMLLEERPDRAPKPAYGLKFSRDEQARNIPGQDPWSGS